MIILVRSLVLQSVLAETQQGQKLAHIYVKCGGILPKYRNVKAERKKKKKEKKK